MQPERKIRGNKDNQYLDDNDLKIYQQTDDTRMHSDAVIRGTLVNFSDLFDDRLVNDKSYSGEHP